MGWGIERAGIVCRRFLYGVWDGAEYGTERLLAKTILNHEEANYFRTISFKKIIQRFSQRDIAVAQVRKYRVPNE